jgi:hypothetical protein
VRMSLVVIPRIIIDTVCEPVLPPVPVSSGM